MSDAKINCLIRMNYSRISVPLSWVATNIDQPFTNFGDGLSAIVVSVMSGFPARHADFDDNIERMVAIGTIGHEQKNGLVHFWGTGVDATRNAVDQTNGFFASPDTQYQVHATRGPLSAKTLRDAGIDAPAIYGDPGWLMPRIWPLHEVEKTHDLGIILHISELSEETLYAEPADDIIRYKIPAKLRSRIKIINTFSEADPESVKNKVAEIVACRRIISTSLHGLVIAETYGIPCSWFSPISDEGGGKFDISDITAEIDHRIADFYAGLGRSTVNAYRNKITSPSDWNAIMDFIDRTWVAVSNYDESSLINAFPLPLSVQPGARRWAVAPGLLESIKL